METILGETAKFFIEKIVSETAPIILERVFRRKQKIFVKFGLVLTFYEYPLFDDAISSIESCILKFKHGANSLKIDDVIFNYNVYFELEDFVGEDFTENDVEAFEPEYMLSKQYISLLEILFFPQFHKESHGKKEIEQIFLSGFRLLEEIMKRLNEDEDLATILKVRSAIRLICIETDLPFAQKFHMKLLKKIIKLKLPYNPYVHFSQILRGNEQIGQIIVSLRDFEVLRSIIDIIV